MIRVTSIAELKNYLPQCKGRDFTEIVTTMKLNPKETTPYQFWNEEHYTRNCIVRSENFELLLLCWEPGQFTPIHGHGGEECWVYMVEGNLHEERFKLDQNNQLVISNQWEMPAYHTSYMEDDMGFHLLRNNSGQRAISLHLYVNPIDSCMVYDEESKQFETKELTYYSLNGIKQKDVLVNN